ncbi:MAG: tetratricopeptide repeat protein [Verrucomicrobiia bacterium]
MQLSRRDKYHQPLWVLLFLLTARVGATGAETLTQEARPAAAPVAYAGSSSCRECHEPFYKLWAPSHHGTAMQPFTPALAKAKLQEQKSPITIGPVSYRANLEDGTVIESSAAGEKVYPIAHTMGGKNVFYFLTPMERGRLQVLPVAFDVRRQAWYDMAASAVRHFRGPSDAPLDWRETPFTFNTACFNCHVSQLSKNYDLTTDTYRTTWAEPGINCETCHGPGGDHIRAAKATPPDKKLTDLKLIVTGTFSRDQMNASCASCHAKLRPISRGFAPGELFYDHFDLAALEDEDFYPDGRDLGENFTYTTWQMSPCVNSGQLDCTHCHTSSGRNRFPGEKANHACLPCHAERVANPEPHSHHKAGPDAPTCVSCHMPITEFARMRRSDHSMRPPMPASTLAHRSPNACNICHTDKDAQWADKSVREWHKDDYQAPELQLAGWVTAARKRDWSVLPAITGYLSTPGRDEIRAASLLRLLRACDDDRKWAGIKPCLQDPSPLVRAAAVEACGDALNPDLIGPLLSAAGDKSRLVRVRAAGALASLPADWIPENDRASVQAATAELQDSLLARPDDSASHYNLGNFHMERRDLPKAIGAFETALKLHPESVPTLVNLSLAHNAAGQNAKAEANLRAALRLEPTNAISNLNFGMLAAELGKLAEAEKAFRTAFTSDPQSAAAAYNLGVLLASTKPEESIAWCRRAAQLRPREPKYSYTLAYYLIQRGGMGEAVNVLENAVARTPPHLESLALLGQLYEERKEAARAVAVYRKAAGDSRLPAAIRQQFAERAQQLDR